MNITKPREVFNVLLAEKVIRELAQRNIDGFYCDRKDEAVSKVLECIPKGDQVSLGGSATLRELDLRTVLRNGGYDLLDPDDAVGGKAKEELARKALQSDTYLMSANAIAESGEIVNLDGIGNRVAALAFGPRRVIIIAGMNKISPDVDTAIHRAKKVAAPLTLLLFKQDYASYDELNTVAAKAWSQLNITEMSIVKGRITVILVGESLGY